MREPNFIDKGMTAFAEVVEKYIWEHTFGQIILQVVGTIAILLLLLVIFIRLYD